MNCETTQATTPIKTVFDLIAHMQSTPLTTAAAARRRAVLQKADACVCKDRMTAYGDAEDNFADIAQLWSWRLGVVISPQTVGELMILMKAARLKANPNYEDGPVDIAGYAACVGGIQCLVKPEEKGC